MKIKIICGFQQKNKSYLDLEAEWLKRLKNSYKIEIIEIKNKHYTGTQAKLDFALSLIERCSPNAYKILLAEDGKDITSKSFANKLENLQVDSISEVNFVIGGPYGVAKEIYQKYNFLLSISPMTLTSELCRVLLIEQLYRAQTINQGLPYHKE